MKYSRRLTTDGILVLVYVKQFADAEHARAKAVFTSGAGSCCRPPRLGALRRAPSAARARRPYRPLPRPASAAGQLLMCSFNSSKRKDQLFRSRHHPEASGTIIKPRQAQQNAQSRPYVRRDTNLVALRMCTWRGGRACYTPARCNHGRQEVSPGRTMRRPSAAVVSSTRCASATAVTSSASARSRAASALCSATAALSVSTSCRDRARRQLSHRARQQAFLSRPS